MKVYRNVQASIKEELEKNNNVLVNAHGEQLEGKLKESLESIEIDTSSPQLTVTMIFAILGCIAAIAGTVFQLLLHFGIIY